MPTCFLNFVVMLDVMHRPHIIVNEVTLILFPKVSLLGLLVYIQMYRKSG